MKLLLLSNSTMPGQVFFTWPRPFVNEVLHERMHVLFIPFAAVTFSFDDYEAIVSKAFAEMGFKIRSIHHESDPVRAVSNADAIAIGGGNTFALLSRLYDHKLLQPIRDRVSAGAPYIGWSAGSNVACPTIMTTNDMPVVQPPSFEALNLVPFQLNPHYTEFKQPGHGGETRMERLQEFLVLNPHRKVIGFPEGMLLRVTDNEIKLKGTGEAKLFSADKPFMTLSTDIDLTPYLSSL